MNNRANTRCRLVGSITAAIALAGLVPATVQAGQDYPDGRVSLHARPTRTVDYPDGRVSLRIRPAAVNTSERRGLHSLADRTPPLEHAAPSPAAVGDNGFSWGDAGIGAAAAFAIVAVLAASTPLIRRRLLAAASVGQRGAGAA